MSFTDGKPFVVTEHDCQIRWGGGKPGERFRCHMCGHKFEPGDTCRWQYTNSTPNAGGNPMICVACDGPDVVERWAAKCKEAQSGKWWWFFGGSE